jgi:hypothetical protein
MLIPKANEERNNYPCWKSAVDQNGNQLRPIIYCKCGQPCEINLHSIDEKGIISTSFWHHKKAAYELNRDIGEVNGCGFHENLQLEGYTGKSFQYE